MVNLKYIAGVDIGNSTTEVCIGSINADNKLHFISSAATRTTGIKGTPLNVKGIINVLKTALEKADIFMNQLSIIRINEATPVIGDTAMETISETIITESTMIGHNPDTPAGVGIATGYIYPLQDIQKHSKSKSYIALMTNSMDYQSAAITLNNLLNDYKITGAIVQKDEAVLIYNRISKKIPIVDEVQYIDKIPIGRMAAIEVAPTGHTIKTLSNPFGMASLFQLDANQTKQVVPIAKSLVGNRSAIVIKTDDGGVKENIIPAGSLTIIGEKDTKTVSLDAGGTEIMKVCHEVYPILDVYGEENTNVGLMINRIKSELNQIIAHQKGVTIKDILAVDTLLPMSVKGALAGEVSMENAVGIAAMVKTEKLPMIKIAESLQKETDIYVNVAGVEAVMAVLGAYTTPGTALPMAILDLGGGSTDAALLDEEGVVKTIHLAGAGELITMLINTELGLENPTLAEAIKRNPLAKVESLFHIRMENGEIKFFEEPLSPRLFGRVIVMTPEEMIPIEKDLKMEKIVETRINIKKKVFVQNTLRALNRLAPDHKVKNIPNVVMVGGSALDFEIPDLILEELSKYGIVSGRGNVRNCEGPRNAVATGLVMSYLGE